MAELLLFRAAHPWARAKFILIIFVFVFASSSYEKGWKGPVRETTFITRLCLFFVNQFKKFCFADMFGAQFAGFCQLGFTNVSTDYQIIGFIAD